MKPPNPLVGDAPYAQAKVTMMGHQLTVLPVRVVENGSCVYLAICAAMYLLTKGKDQEILDNYLGTTELTNCNMVAGFGEKIVKCDIRTQGEQGIKSLERASQFRSLLVDCMNGKKDKFFGYFKDKDPRNFCGDSEKNSGEGQNSDQFKKKKSWKSVSTSWENFIRDEYWDNVLAIILGDLFPSLSIVLLHSGTSLLKGKGLLHFFDGEEQQLLTSRDEKMRIVLHSINPALNLFNRVHHTRPRNSESSDNNHFEYVQLEGDLQFQFPKMDSGLLAKLVIAK